MRSLKRVNVCYVMNSKGKRVDIDPRMSRKYRELGYKVIKDFEFIEVIQWVVSLEQ